tara:strand:- start:59 stop:1195 length:1137 start_codon:yes stop_codon:yes gene_type:complete
MSKSLGDLLKKLDLGAFTDSIKKFNPNRFTNFDPTSLDVFLKGMNVDDLSAVVKNLDKAERVKILGELKRLDDVDDIADIARQLDLPDEAISAAGTAAKKIDDVGDAAKSADELAEIGSLAKRKTALSGESASKVNKFYREMSETALEAQADAFVMAGETGIDALKNLPFESQALLLKKSPGLRIKAKKTGGPLGYLSDVCKVSPSGCSLAKGIGGLGVAVGVGFALEEVYDKVLDAITNDKDVAGCIATCYPNDWYESTASGSGTKDYKDLDFKTIEGLRVSTGNEDITLNNTPICTINMTGETCASTCKSRCEDINKTFLQRLANSAKTVVKEASGVAGEGLGGFLDGFFGDGMGIPSAIGIFVFIMIVMVLVTMM